MPPIFKALATLSAWVLFIYGWFALVIGTIGAALGGAFFGPVPPPIATYLGAGVGAACFILGVCAMKLRQMLE